MKLLWIAALCGALFATPAWAHKANDAFLQVSPDAGTPLRLSLALRDIDVAVPLDANGDGQTTSAEVQAKLPAIQDWVGQGTRLLSGAGGEACTLRWAAEGLERRPEGPYLRLVATPSCPAADSWTLEYRLLEATDPTHRLIVAGQYRGKDVAGVLTPGRQRARLALDAGPPGLAGGLQALAGFFPEGMAHLLSGLDHIAFLLVLLLPIAVAPVRGTPLGEATGRMALWQLVRTVTGFTIGHSVTLTLASLSWVSASAQWVEPAIAATIMVSAGLNLRPIRGLRSDALALGFGLIHGLGFSSVMLESGVSDRLLPWALAGFNLGVEAGQLAVVGVWVLLQATLLQRLPDYQRQVVRPGSLVLLLVALYWLVQRLVTG